MSLKNALSAFNSMYSYKNDGMKSSNERGMGDLCVIAVEKVMLNGSSSSGGGGIGGNMDH